MAQDSDTLQSPALPCMARAGDTSQTPDLSCMTRDGNNLHTLHFADILYFQYPSTTTMSRAALHCMGLQHFTELSLSHSSPMNLAGLTNGVVLEPPQAGTGNNRKEVQPPQTLSQPSESAPYRHSVNVRCFGRVQLVTVQGCSYELT